MGSIKYIAYMYKSLKDYYIGGEEPEAGEVTVKQLKTVAVLTEEPTWEAPCTHTWRLNPTFTPAPGAPIQPSGLHSHLHPYGTYSLLSHTHSYI